MFFNRLKAYRRLPALILPILLPACSSISYQDCKEGNWHEIGRKDGIEGRTLERLERHTKTCRSIGIAPDNQQYHAGRDEGLKLYCTPQTGFRLAHAGQSYNAVCPPDLAQRYSAGYRLGAELYQAEKPLRDIKSKISSRSYEISSNERKIDDLIEEIAQSTDSSEKIRLRWDLNSARQKLREAEREIARLQAAEAREDVRVERIRASIVERLHKI